MYYVGNTNSLSDGMKKRWCLQKQKRWKDITIHRFYEQK